VGVAAQGELQHNTVINCDCVPRRLRTQTLTITLMLLRLSVTLWYRVKIAQHIAITHRQVLSVVCHRFDRVPS